MAYQEINDGLDSGFEHSELVMALLDTPEVQRTGHIIQNGMAETTYPGISHKRKAHLIGVAKRGVQSFFALQRNGSAVDDSDKYLIEASAICHDLGHSPFSHSLADVMEAISGKTHEEFSAKIIKGEVSFFEYFSQRPGLLGNPDLVKESLKRYSKLPSIPQILSSYGVDPNIAAALLSESGAGIPVPGQKMFIKNLLDDPIIDIDKMDYLQRDSKAANVHEGYVDPTRILNGMRLADFKGEKRLAFADSCLDVMSFWVKARKHMRQNVYTHKTVLKYEIMLREAVKRSIPFFQENGIEIQWLTDSKLMELLMQYDQISSSLALDIQYGRHFKYDEAFSIKSRNVVSGSEPNQCWHDLCKIDDFASAATGLFYEDTLRKKIVDIVNQTGMPIRDYEVLVYHRNISEKRDPLDKASLMIYSKNNPSEARPLREIIEGSEADCHANDLGHQLSQPDFSTYFAVYCPKEHTGRVQKAAQKFIKDIRQ